MLSKPEDMLSTPSYLLLRPDDINKAMERVTTKQAAAELNMDITTLQYLMRAERLPIGYALKQKGKKRTVYIIYRGMLDQFKKKVAGGI